MKIKFWGVRGSIPTPGASTVHFGGNTSSLEIVDDNAVIILDAGTGIRMAGLDLVRKRPELKDIHVIFSHTHWDHIQGLPFFVPLLVKGYRINIYGPVHYEKSLEEILDRQMEYTYFPVRVAELQAEIAYQELKEEEFTVSGYKVTTKYLNHPVLCLGYRFEKDGKSFVYCTDHEPYYNYLGEDDPENEMDHIIDEQNRRLEDFVRGADLLVMDSQYTPEEYETHVGWGHSSTKHTMDLVLKTGVKRIALTHHDPERADDTEKLIIEGLQKHLGESDALIEIFGAEEGLEVEI
jgi:phosphoribosyl 1,2-cyclic phosphodiesterase